MIDPLSDLHDAEHPEPLWVALRVGDRSYAPDALESWGPDSVTLLFSGDGPQIDLASGDGAQLTVRSSLGTLQLQVDGAVERVEPYGGGLRCKLAFDDHAALTRQLAATARLFERRTAPRVQAPSPTSRAASHKPARRPVRVSLDQRGATAVGTLTDLSTGGVGAVFVDGRNLPAVGSTVLVELDLPPGDEPLVATCRAASIERAEHGVRVGLAFTSGPGRTTPDLEERILQYVLLRQRDIFSRDAA